MNTAWRTTLRAFVIFLALAIPLIAAATPVSAAVVINEVESDGGTVADFVELINTNAAPVDIGGYVVKDSDDTHVFTLPAGTTVSAGGYYVADVESGFGLNASDSARLFAPANLVTPLDSFTWTSHATATYGRCPNGTGAMSSTISPTRGAANDCPVTPGPPVTPTPVTPTPAAPSPPPAAASSPDTTLDGSVAAKKNQGQKEQKIAIKAIVRAAETMTAQATGQIKVGKAFYALKPLTKSIAAGASVTLKLMPAKVKDARGITDALANEKKVTAKLSVELTDVAGNRASEALSVKLEG